MPYFPLYCNDFDASTAAWSCVSVGAYIRLLNYSWVNDGLPDREQKLRRIVRAELDEWDEIWEEVGPKWKPDETGRLRNARQEQARQDATAKYEQRVNAGKRSAAARKKVQENEPPNEKATTVTTTVPTTVERPLASRSNEPPNENATSQNQNQNQSLKSTTANAVVVDLPKDKSTRACPQKEILQLYHEILPELRRHTQWSDARQTALRARWRESCKRQDLDWWRGFFNYVKESDFLMGRVEAANGSKPFQADLEWLIKSSNFVKVVEGKYANRA